MTRRIVAIATTFLMLFAFMAGPALADHGVAHNGETAEISKADGLTQDEVVTVTGMGYAPGASLTVVQCFVFPAAGPTDCELSNYGLYTATVGDDGTASVDYTVNIVDGQCDADNPCFIVVSDGIGPDGNGVGMEVTFAAADDGAVDDAEDAIEAPPEDEPVDEEPVEEPTEVPVDDEPEAEVDDADAETDVADDDADSDDDGGGSGWLIPVIIGVVVLGGVGAFLASRNKK